MKSTLNVLVLSAVLLVVQSCGSKVENSKEKPTETPAATERPKEQTAAERLEMLRRDSAAVAEKRKAAYDAIVLNSPTYTDSMGNLVYRRVDINPMYAGGDKAMMKYLRDNIVFPEAAKADKLEGTVFVDFVIDTKGVVSGVEVTDATSTEVDQLFRTEAIRVVSSMPTWVPGRQNNKPVNVKYSIPITFRMI